MPRGVGGHSPANILKHLKGTHFPTTKNDILSNAERAEGPDTDQVLEILQQISDKQYQSAPEILKEIGKIK